MTSAFVPPERFRSAIDAALARYRVWKGDAETVAFTYVTDIHSRYGDVSDPPDYSDTKMHVPLALWAADRAEADFAADLGDQDFELAAVTRPNFEARVQASRILYGNYVSRPVLFCVGNHDYGHRSPFDLEMPLSSSKFGELFCRMAADHGFDVRYGSDPSWGYYDVAAKKTRTFFLNSSDGGYYGFSKSQLEFLRDNVCNLPDGWTVLVLQHYTPLPGYAGRCRGGIRPRPNPRFPRCDVQSQMLVDIVARKKGGGEDLEWDFTCLAARDIRFAGCVCGDYHTDQTGNYMGVPVAISQGYGKWEGPDDLSEMRRTIYTYFNPNEEPLFELVAVKPDERIVHVFRVGAGAPARDREWRY